MSKKIIIKCNDCRAAKTYEVDEHVANQSPFLKHYIDMQPGDHEGDCKIPLPASIRSTTFEKVIYYCQILANAKDEEEINGRELCSHIRGDRRLDKLHKLIAFVKAVEYLGVERLEDAACEILSTQMRFLSPLDLRKRFRIVGDNTPEVEARVKAWNWKH